MKKNLITLCLSVLLAASLSSCANLSGSSLQNETSPSGQNPLPEAAAPSGSPTFEPYEPVELPISSDLIDTIMSAYSSRTFKEGVVPDDVLETILQTGQKAPSATNAQPWYFTAVRNSEIAEQLAARTYAEGGVVIVVSGKADEGRGVNVAFDCALATQNMYLAAQSLGLGAHIYYGGVDNINNNMKSTLGIPDDYEAQIIMHIGYIDDSEDAATTATPRNKISGNVSYID